jgi:hypothetical protein
MAKFILIDEFHFTIRAPHKLPESEYDAIRSVLDGARFQTQLRHAVNAVVQQYSRLSKVRVNVAR